MTSIGGSLDEVAVKLATLVRRQRVDLDPAHEDFYAWGWALTEFANLLRDAAELLAQQVAASGDRRILRDDEGADPGERLADARQALSTLAAQLSDAGKTAVRYHALIGHIGVEVDLEAGPEA